VRTTITKKEVEKATADGLITAQDSIQFPSTDRIPKPPSGYRVMFQTASSPPRTPSSFPVPIGSRSPLAVIG
jgi:hypothetical protein